MCRGKLQKLVRNKQEKKNSTKKKQYAFSSCAVAVCHLNWFLLVPINSIHIFYFLFDSSGLEAVLHATGGTGIFFWGGDFWPVWIISSLLGTLDMDDIVPQSLTVFLMHWLFPGDRNNFSETDKGTVWHWVMVSSLKNQFGEKIKLVKPCFWWSFFSSSSFSWVQ